MMMKDKIYVENYMIEEEIESKIKPFYPIPGDIVRLTEKDGKTEDVIVSAVIFQPYELVDWRNDVQFAIQFDILPRDDIRAGNFREIFLFIDQDDNHCFRDQPNDIDFKSAELLVSPVRSWYAEKRPPSCYTCEKKIKCFECLSCEKDHRNVKIPIPDLRYIRGIELYFSTAVDARAVLGLVGKEPAACTGQEILENLLTYLEGDEYHLPIHTHSKYLTNYMPEASYTYDL